MAVIFWICLTIVVYTFVGYGAALFVMVKIKKRFARPKPVSVPVFKPTCSVIIAAYNEETFIREKILNTLSLHYPQDRLKVFVVADGSTDDTVKIVNEFPDIHLLYQESRLGKVHAINRAMQYINSEVVIFTDANTYLNEDALLYICNHYSNLNVGGVAGEKRIYAGEAADASSAGESLYWKYESTLKKWDSELNTAVGAAGELFSIRRTLYEPVSESTILDDFIISMRIAQQGFQIVYEPNAYAMETSSSDINEELKRKFRIAAGGIQAIIALKGLFNLIRHPLLTFQYISHRVLRWTVTPFLLIIVFITNTVLSVESSSPIYQVILCLQVIFYLLAVIGHVLEKRKLKMKIAFVPYYFCVMNYSVIIGILNFFKKKQSSIWEKSERKQSLDKIVVTPTDARV